MLFESGRIIAINFCCKKFKIHFAIIPLVHMTELDDDVTPIRAVQIFKN